MKVVFGKTLWFPVFALAMALVASAEARAGLLPSSFDPASPTVHNAFAEFASFDYNSVELRDRYAVQDPFAETAGAAQPAKAPRPKFPRVTDQIAAMHAAASPVDASGAGALSSGHGPSSQVVGFCPALQLPTPQVVMRLRLSDSALHPQAFWIDLFRPPRLAL